MRTANRTSCPVKSSYVIRCLVRKILAYAKAVLCTVLEIYIRHLFLLSKWIQMCTNSERQDHQLDVRKSLAIPVLTLSQHLPRERDESHERLLSFNKTVSGLSSLDEDTDGPRNTGFLAIQPPNEAASQRQFYWIQSSWKWYLIGTTSLVFFSLIRKNKSLIDTLERGVYCYIMAVGTYLKGLTGVSVCVCMPARMKTELAERRK
jgi:hypothetical protein